MIPVLSAEEMRAADRVTIEEIGLPGVVLMENAGAAVAAALRERFARVRRIVVLCGRGNNGGDGLVITRRLRARGAEALLFGRREEIRGDARVHLEAAERSDARIREVPDDGAWARVRESVEGAEVLVDALLGTGLKSRPTGLVAEAIGWLARRAQEGTPVVAVDIPSGVPSDGGGFDWPVARATLTVTFAAPKWGHVLPPGCDAVGELMVADIGIPTRALEKAGFGLALLEDADVASAFPPRPPGSHKGRFGHVLVVAGSVGKTGAAVLAATGALRTGAGLVTVATPEPCLPVVAAARAEVMTAPVAATPKGALAEEGLETLLALARERDGVVLGPGLGRDPSTERLVRAFASRCPVPLLVDADGLNALAPGSDHPGPGELRGRSAGTVLTPHPGEMARLCGRPVPEVQADRPRSAAELARATGAVVVLKGQRSVVAEPGGRLAVTPAGNPGLATGGTGDVLSGIVGALLARLDAWPAATAGVHLHGRAGDLAAAALGEEGVAAGDVADSIPRALAEARRAGDAASRR
jgi:ADP-dependent NAD(P)H-hydrate dehydratase / NAD(P)H-hydrate epimerase